MKQILYTFLLQIAISLCAITALLAQAPLQHVVKKSETVYSISRHYGVFEEDIYRLNDGSQWGIREGQTLLIPPREPETRSADAQVEPGIHIVQPGETLYGISRRYGLTVSKILEFNSQKLDAHITVGERLVIDPKALRKKVDIPFDGSTRKEQVRVGMLLPISESGQPSRFLRFYEGVLLAIEQLQRQGVSIDLQVEGAVDYPTLKSLLATKETPQYDLIIGGDSEQSVELLSRLASEQYAVYLSPFVWQSGKGQLYPLFFQQNPAQYRITERLKRAFVASFADCEVLLVRCADGDQEDKFKAIESACREAKIPLHNRSLRELSIGQWPRKGGKRVIILLNSSKKEHLTEMLDIVTQAKLSVKDYQLFGYPQWQTYGKEITDRLRDVKAKIFSTFYWDRSLPECQRLNEEYKRWYGRNLDISYPSYALLGYDLVRYFVSALSTYGKDFNRYLDQLPHDGLQSGFLFAPAITGQKDRSGGYTNLNLFFITYTPQGELREQIPLAQ